MRIAVTGSSGRIGCYVAQEIDNAGHQVVGLDVQHDTQAKGGQLLVDLTDAGQVYGALAGCEAVVHMGAWANPGVVPDTRTYADNTTGTFNLLQAAADLGIRRVVSASSNQVYGFFEAPPLYAPVDQEHSCRPVNCYALSKTAGEQAAEYFSRHNGLDILSLRILGTRMPEEIPGDVAKIVADPASAAKLLWTRTDARDAAVGPAVWRWRSTRWNQALTISPGRVWYWISRRGNWSSAILAIAPNYATVCRVLSRH